MMRRMDGTRSVFLSTPSARRATYVSCVQALDGYLFLSTPSARRATPATILTGTTRTPISIHALREEGDVFRLEHRGFFILNFYPRPPRGGRPALGRYRPQANPISIHALREEGDDNNVHILHIACTFLSTPSARRATAESWSWTDSHGISIHALREEGDRVLATTTTRATKFLSTPSARRATYGLTKGYAKNKFLSTPSARRATSGATQGGYTNTDFYPRPPRGGRRYGAQTPSGGFDFYPRPPRGGRPVIDSDSCQADDISIHALREEGDL